MAVTRDTAQAFFGRWLDRVGPGQPYRSQGSALHEELVQSTLGIPPVAEPVRRPSISLDGTPVMYSLQFPVEKEHPAFRVLFEPGGLGLTVPQQVDRSLTAVQAMLDRLGWQTAASEINAVTAAVFPRDPAVASTFWGGIWLGAAIGPDRAELRIYLNLRHGDATSRWQRVVEAMRPFADQQLEEPVRDLIRRAGAVSIPVGLGIVIHAGRLAALRVYTGMEQPGVETILRAQPEQFARGTEALVRICHAFTSDYGPFPRQGVTLAYDFVRSGNGFFVPRVARFKADIACEMLPPDVKSTPQDFFAGQLAELWPNQVRHWQTFRADLYDCFGGAGIRYISMGFRDGLSHLTAYVVPEGAEHEQPD